MNQSHHKKPPIEGKYIAQARRAAVAQRLQQQALDELESAKRACATAMQDVGVSSFEFSVPDGDYVVKYDAQLGRQRAKRVSVEKLYTLVKEGEISLDEFLMMVKADAGEVKALLGESRLPGLVETFDKPFDLIIKPKG